MNWNLYYFAVLQYGPSILLTLFYKRSVRCHKWMKKHQLKEAPVTVLSPEVTITTYNANLMA